MQGPRTPVAEELPRIIDFLNSKLRSGVKWSIANEYPTALTSTNLHNMRIIADNEKILSHAVIKPLVIKAPHVILKISAIGSVVTDPEHRNKGLSTQIMEDCLQESRKQFADLAILWTDKHDFYRRIGFELAGSEIAISLNKPLPFLEENLRFSSDPKISPEAVLRLYNQHTVGSSRTTEDIRRFMTIPNTKIYTAWNSIGQLTAYAVEGKGADLGLHIHEWGGQLTHLITLLAWIISKNGTQSPHTILAGKQNRQLIERLSSLGLPSHHGYLGMMKILDIHGLSQKINRAFRAIGVSDFILEDKIDHILFGIGDEIFPIYDRSDLIKILFGPVEIEKMDLLSKVNATKLGRILPLPLWLWGWDSV